jgi:hypothetical protein
MKEKPQVLLRVYQKSLYFRYCPFRAGGEQMDNITASASVEHVVFHRNIALVDLALKCIALLSDNSQRNEAATELLRESIIPMLEKNNG